MEPSCSWSYREGHFCRRRRSPRGHTPQTRWAELKSSWEFSAVSDFSRSAAPVPENKNNENWSVNKQRVAPPTTDGQKPSWQLGKSLPSLSVDPLPVLCVLPQTSTQHQEHSRDDLVIWQQRHNLKQSAFFGWRQMKVWNLINRQLGEMT